MDKFTVCFRALADRTRLRIIHLLIRAERELCICEIEKCLDIAQYNVSKHTRELKIAGLITERKQGRFVYYRLCCENNGFYRCLLKTIQCIPEKFFLDDIKRLKKLKAGFTKKCLEKSCR
ncbi:MAG: metalloregulator ArsR/SmtB family transcription factor [Candidatus Omnitrophica bacterium]|nr:metalloregulator ArsR/SmtB family transcription factor [Candidatus Omnitrophota bacterium]